MQKNQRRNTVRLTVMKSALLDLPSDDEELENASGSLSKKTKNAVQSIGSPNSANEMTKSSTIKEENLAETSDSQLKQAKGASEHQLVRSEQPDDSTSERLTPFKFQAVLKTENGVAGSNDQHAAVEKKLIQE